jgi:cellulose synthase/poly-beta-1,6-N-acetylglucosamine synthase-like glycosyltransferase
MNVPVLRHLSGSHFNVREAGRDRLTRPPERRIAGRITSFAGIAGDPLSEEQLLAQAGVPFPRLQRIKSLARRWGVSLREAAVSIGAIRQQSYVRSVAAAHRLTRSQVRETILLRNLSPAPEPHRLLTSAQPVPLEIPRGGFAANAEAVSPYQLTELIGSLGAARNRLAIVSQSALKDAIVKTYGAELTVRAADGLWQRNPRFSAATGLIRWQRIVLSIAAGLFLGAAIFIPREAMVVYSAALSFMFLITILLRVAAASHAFYRNVFGRRKTYRRLRDKDLPRYTVLVAMFKEAGVLPELAAGLRALNYPAAKLDIKLIFEEVDEETIAVAKALSLPSHFEIVIVPDGKPRTKPRALNYALQFASGEYVVIYDAEDRPDPNQLRKAAAHFREAPPKVVCLQGKLTFDNASENWLAKQFTIEYASLFGGILPMLDKTRLPIPLGGTSNHFRAKILRQLGGWDAYNVTEDADLGMRIYRAGLRAEVLDSLTYEEACCQPGNWIRQRTRWLKGWMQTYCVHMRQPLRLLSELGLPGFLTFQGHFAGIIVAALVHPLSYVLIAHDILAGIFLSAPETQFGQHILTIALFNLIAGYTASLALGFFVLQARGVRMLIPQLIFIPFYWLLISVAAYRAVYQLITAPHYWEKTEHGLTSMSRKRA